MTSLLSEIFPSSIFVFCGCMNSIHTSPRIEIVSSANMDMAKDDAISKLQPGPGKYENWIRLHGSVKSILSKYGSVSWDPIPSPDFYFSGDWFHENSDGFGISSSRPISKALLIELQQLLANEHNDAILEFTGMEDPIDGLVIFATSTRTLVGWADKSADACKERLHDLGLKLD